MGKDWAERHYAMPGRPEPVKYGNLWHDRACAERWHELTGEFPKWFMHVALSKGKDVRPQHEETMNVRKWWVLNYWDGERILDMGPYDTKREAEEDMTGVGRETGDAHA
jgi:hypothetical protein